MVIKPEWIPQDNVKCKEEVTCYTYFGKNTSGGETAWNK
jgi:hypothetical protein